MHLVTSQSRLGDLGGVSGIGLCRETEVVIAFKITIERKGGVVVLYGCSISKIYMSFKMAIAENVRL